MIFPFFLCGVYLVARTRLVDGYILFMMFLYLPFVFVFQAAARYRHSMAPFIILLAAAGLEDLSRRLKGRRWPVLLWAWLALNVFILAYAEPIRLLARKINQL